MISSEPIEHTIRRSRMSLRRSLRLNRDARRSCWWLKTPSSSITAMVDTSSSQAMEQGLIETIQKVEASVLTAIEEHLSSSADFSPQQGLDFLDTKNSLLLSYLIDLTVHLRNRLTNQQEQDDDHDNNNDSNTTCIHRLLEMRTVLDKMRNLDKRLRYQIDKLLSYQSTASSFATGADALNKSNNNANNEDPLQFRPSVEALEDDGDYGDDRDKDDSSSQEDNGSEADDDADDDLATARQTLRMVKAQQQHDNDKQHEAAMSSEAAAAVVYQAPRLAAVPYTQDQDDRQAEREKRQRRRMRASELAMALRQEFGDAPEQQDIHGGSEVGQQRAAARRLAERQAEKTKFEEDQMVRLTVTRKEKKEKRRLMREENSNLAAIADLGNLVRDAAFIDKNEKKKKQQLQRGDDEYGVNDGMIMSGRHTNGKRKRQMIDSDGRAMSSGSGRKKRPTARNALQAALFSGGGGKSKKKTSKKSF